MVRKWLGVTAPGASCLLKPLLDVGVLCRITGFRRNRRFRFEPYLRLFTEPDESEY
jgi:hypothetical protein